MSGPHLLNLPPPPSDTPSDLGPGTPNSDISQLSTVAFKEGERGKFRPYGSAHQVSSASESSTTLDAERADRISRLAGLERVATLRGSQPQNLQQNHQSQQPGYFDASSNIYRSTVGSASATGSMGGSVPESADKMSEDAEDNLSSTGLSDDGNASLVGFGEAASSNLSGPTSTNGKGGGSLAMNALKQHRLPKEGLGSGLEEQSSNQKSSAREQAEKIIDATMHDIDGRGLSGSGEGRDLGSFPFENK